MLPVIIGGALALAFFASGCASPDDPKGGAPAKAPSAKKPEPKKPVTGDPKPSAPAAPQNALITWQPNMVQDMTSHDPSQWSLRSGINKDPHFNCVFQPDNISFNNGVMSLSIDKDGAGGRPYGCAEYRTSRETFGDGYYEARMRAAQGSGTVTSFFTYVGDWGKPNHFEIDFEVLGKDCGTVQTNYYAAGSKENEEKIPLPFDACREFHNYGFRLERGDIKWYIDGKQVRHERTGVAFAPARVMVNLWPGKGVDGWLGAFNYPGRPLTAEYDWIQYASLSGGPAGGDAVQPPGGDMTPAQIPARGPERADTIRANRTGGAVVVDGGTYTLTAKNERDPGFTYSLFNMDATGKTKITFRAMGSVVPRGTYATLAMEIYSTSDDVFLPSKVSEILYLEPGNWKTFEVGLPEGIERLDRITFVIMTDAADCNIKIGGIKVE